jgi:hypothetical protein
MEHVRGRGEVHTDFWWGDLGKGNHLEDPSVDSIILLKYIFKGLGSAMDCIHLARDMGSWQAHVNAIIYLRVP